MTWWVPSWVPEVVASGKSGMIPKPILQLLTARGDQMRGLLPSKEDRRKYRRLSTCFSRQSGKIHLSLEEDLDVEEEGDIESKEVSH